VTDIPSVLAEGRAVCESMISPKPHGGVVWSITTPGR
jgi:hypothetical protein